MSGGFLQVLRSCLNILQRFDSLRARSGSWGRFWGRCRSGRQHQQQQAQAVRAPCAPRRICRSTQVKHCLHMPHYLCVLLSLMRHSFGGMDGDMNMLASLARCLCPSPPLRFYLTPWSKAVEPQAARRRTRFGFTIACRVAVALALGQILLRGQLRLYQKPRAHVVPALAHTRLCSACAAHLAAASSAAFAALASCVRLSLL